MVARFYRFVFFILAITVANCAESYQRLEYHASVSDITTRGKMAAFNRDGIVELILPTPPKSSDRCPIMHADVTINGEPMEELTPGGDGAEGKARNTVRTPYLWSFTDSSGYSHNCYPTRYRYVIPVDKQNSGDATIRVEDNSMAVSMTVHDLLVTPKLLVETTPLPDHKQHVTLKAVPNSIVVTDLVEVDLHYDDVPEQCDNTIFGTIHCWREDSFVITDIRATTNVFDFNYGRFSYNGCLALEKKGEHRSPQLNASVTRCDSHTTCEATFEITKCTPFTKN